MYISPQLQEPYKNSKKIYAVDRIYFYNNTHLLSCDGNTKTNWRENTHNTKRIGGNTQYGARTHGLEFIRLAL